MADAGACAVALRDGAQRRPTRAAPTEVVTTVAHSVKVDHDNLPGRLVRRPGAGGIQAMVDNRAIVEPYSR
jgi:hypothetical protein